MLRTADIHSQIRTPAKAEKTHCWRPPSIARMTTLTGDIVENSLIKGIIKWRSSAFVVYDKNDDWMLLDIAAGKRLKIIGNIYEDTK